MLPTILNNKHVVLNVKINYTYTVAGLRNCY